MIEQCLSNKNESATVAKKKTCFFRTEQGLNVGTKHIYSGHGDVPPPTGGNGARLFPLSSSTGRPDPSGHWHRGPGAAAARRPSGESQAKISAPRKSDCIPLSSLLQFSPSRGYAKQAPSRGEGRIPCFLGRWSNTNTAVAPPPRQPHSTSSPSSIPPSVPILSNGV